MVSFPKGPFLSWYCGRVGILCFVVKAKRVAPFIFAMFCEQQSVLCSCFLSVCAVRNCTRIRTILLSQFTSSSYTECMVWLRKFTSCVQTFQMFCGSRCYEHSNFCCENFFVIQNTCTCKSCPMCQSVRANTLLS